MKGFLRVFTYQGGMLVERKFISQQAYKNILAELIQDFPDRIIEISIESKL